MRTRKQQIIQPRMHQLSSSSSSSTSALTTKAESITSTPATPATKSKMNAPSTSTCTIKKAKRRSLANLQYINGIEYLIALCISIFTILLQSSSTSNDIDKTFYMHYITLISCTPFLYFFYSSRLKRINNSLVIKQSLLRECEDPIGFPIACCLISSVSIVFYHSTISLIILSSCTWVFILTLFITCFPKLSLQKIFIYSFILCSIIIFAIYHDHNFILIVLAVNFASIAFINCCKRTFTVVESVIISICISSSIYSNLLLFQVKKAYIPEIDLIIKIGIGFCCLFTIFCIFIPCEPSISNIIKPKHGFIIAIKLATLAYTLLSRKFPNKTESPIPWTLNYIMENKFLILVWSFILISLFLMNWKVDRLTISKSKSKSKTMLRKLYHLIAFTIFMIGLMVNGTVLKLASIFGLFLLLLGESIRIRCLGSHNMFIYVNNLSNTLLDERDSGDIVVTHIYLLLGCCIPVWIDYSSRLFIAKGGVVAICIQDAVAAIIGKQYGKTKWGRRNRTVEGSIAGIVAASLVAIACIQSTRTFVHICVCVAAAVTGLVEAFTDQADNLIVPLTFCTVLKGLVDWQRQS